MQMDCRQCRRRRPGTFGVLAPRDRPAGTPVGRGEVDKSHRSHRDGRALTVRRRHR